MTDLEDKAGPHRSSGEADQATPRAQPSTTTEQYVSNESEAQPGQSKKYDAPPVNCRMGFFQRHCPSTQTMWNFLVTVFTGLLTLITYWQYQLGEKALEVSRLDQQPWVSLGKANSTIVEYIPPPPGGEKGTMLLFFQNTGSAPALNFVTNVYSWLSLESPMPNRHVVRWRQIDEKGRVKGYPIYERATIGADSVHVVIIDQEWIPYAAEWELMNANKWEGSFLLGGNFEYCDQWGKLHCEEFFIHYKPPPIGRFVAHPYDCSIGFPPPLKRSDISASPDILVEILPPCEQPGERQAEEDKYNQ